MRLVGSRLTLTLAVAALVDERAGRVISVSDGDTLTVRVASITQAQRLLREDIIDKALKRDMTALFGVRRVLDLEHTISLFVHARWRIAEYH